MTNTAKPSWPICPTGRASILLWVVVVSAGLLAHGEAAQPAEEGARPPAQVDVAAIEEAVDAIRGAADNPKMARTVIEAHLPALLDGIYASYGQFSYSVVLSLDILGRAMREAGEHLPSELEETLLDVANSEDFRRLVRSRAAEALGYVRPLSDKAVEQLIALTEVEETSNGAWPSIAGLLDESEKVREFVLDALRRGTGGGVLDLRQTFDLELMEALSEGIMITGGTGGFFYLQRFEDHIPDRQRLFQRVAETAMDTSKDPVRRGRRLSRLYGMSSEDAKAALGEAVAAILRESNPDTDLLRSAIRYSARIADYVPDGEAH